MILKIFICYNYLSKFYTKIREKKGIDKTLPVLYGRHPKVFWKEEAFKQENSVLLIQYSLSILLSSRKTQLSKLVNWMQGSSFPHLRWQIILLQSLWVRVCMLITTYGERVVFNKYSNILTNMVAHTYI